MCNGHGECAQDGSCNCTGTFTGPTCSDCIPHYYGSLCNICMKCNTIQGYFLTAIFVDCLDSTCNEHGECGGDGICNCTDNFTGSNCSDCLSHYYGPLCDISMDIWWESVHKGRCHEELTLFIDCFDSMCNGHGFCGSNGACNCTGNFTGSSCSDCLSHYYGPLCETCK